MCGICGFVGKGELSDLHRMNQTIRHRGPDAEGYWHDRNAGVYFGHRRLSIIDLEGGHQPMKTADGQLVVSYNGEIYNHVELRQELEKRGHVFTTDHSDTEVLLHGFREWGSRLPEKLNGMWAFAVLDRKEKRLFLSRDRFGKKPVFYTIQHGTFVFASELSALIRHPSVEPTVSMRSLKKYFAYGYIPAPNSLFSRVYKLAGGHNLVLDADTLSVRIWKYWDFVLEPFESIPSNPEEQWGEQLRDLLGNAVRRRLMSDVPLGVFLSGGIDSSSIVAFASQGAGGERLKTFSIGFREESFDESAHARKIAGLFGTDHHERQLSIERDRGLLPKIMERLDEPMGDSSLLPTYLLCRETRKHVTVALSGDAGDELFAGYDPFRALRMAEAYKKLVPKPLHRAVRMAVGMLPVSHRNMSLDFKLKRTLRGLSYPKHLWNSIWLGPLEPTEVEALFDEPVDIEDVYSEAIEQWEACQQDHLVDKTLQFYTKLYLQDDILVKSDRASMMNSLEVRAPFLDLDLVDFVRRVPHDYKFRRGQTKYLLKKALEPMLPTSVLYRAKKGFGIPIGKWLRDGHLGISDQTLPKYINRHFIALVNREHNSSLHDHRAVLWNLWVAQKNEAVACQL